MRLQIWILLLTCLHCSAFAQNVLTTFAGTDWVFPGSGKPAISAPFSNIENVTLDATGRVVFADPGNAVVVRIETSGSVTVLAGNGLQRYSGDGGPAVSAALNTPTDAAFDASGNLYIADLGNNRIRMVTPDGTIKTIAGTGVPGFSGDGQPAVNAMLNSPLRVTVDPAGNLYISDDLNWRVRKVTPAGTISTVAGNGQASYSGDNGPATLASLNDIEAMATDAAGNLYLADFNNNRVRKVNTQGIITTVAGDGKGRYFGDGLPATLASLYSPSGVFVDSSNNIYISDTNDYRVRKINPQGIISTIAGTGMPGFSGDGGSALLATFAAPFGLTLDSKGDLFVADRDNYRVREINAASIISTIAGNGTFRFFPNGTPAANAFLYQPFGVSLDNKGNIYVADTFNNRIRLISPSGTVSTIGGNGSMEWSGDGGPATLAGINGPTSVTPDNTGNLYIADTDNDCIRKISASGIITTVAGTSNPGDSGDGGLAINATLNSPQQVVLDGSGNLYISDYGNNVIREVTPNGQINRFAGNGRGAFCGDGGPASAACLNLPTGMVLVSGTLYVADWGNARVRAINLVNGTISTFAGGGTQAADVTPKPATQVALGFPAGMVADSSGNIYLSDAGINRILKISSSGMLAIVAGTGTRGFSGDGGPATQGSFNFAYGLALDSAGDLLFADAVNNRIRTVLAAPPSLQISPGSLTFSADSGGALTDTQSINIGSSVPGLIYSLTPSTSPGCAWLKTNVSGGNLPASVQVFVDPTGVQPGNYQCAIQATASGATASEVVNLSVNKGANPQLGINSSTVSFSFSAGASGSSQNLTINNTGGGTLNFSASIVPVSGGNWLSVSPAQGQVTPIAPGAVALQASPGTLAAGTYQSMLNIKSDSGQSAAIPVYMTISVSAQTLILSQSALKFTVVAGGGTPLSQRIAVANGGSGTLNWTAASTVLSGAVGQSSWLTPATAGGASVGGAPEIPYFDVNVNAAALAAGEYYGQIKVTAPGAVNSPESLTVILDVLAAGSDPGPDVEPSGLIFTGVSGNSPGSQLVSIANLSTNSTGFSGGQVTLDGQNWLFQAPVNGTVAPGQPAQVVVQPDFSNLPAGTYRGVLTFAFGQGTVRTVNVLSIVAPASGATAMDRSSRIGPDAASCKPSKLNIVFPSLSAGFPAVVGQPTPIAAKISDDCGNPVTNAVVVNTTFSNGDKDLGLTYSNGTWSNTWRPVHLTASVTVIVTAITSLSGANSVTGTLRASTTPVVVQGGIVHAASFAAGAPLAPGSLITIYGSNLADTTGLAPGTPLPCVLNGAQAEMGSSADCMPLLYTSDGQLNVQVPYGVPVDAPYQIAVQHDNMLSVPENLVIAEAQPGIFTVNLQGTGQGIIFKSDGVTLAQPGTPAAPNETVVIYCTGLGAVSPSVAAGQPAPAAPLSMTVLPVTLSIGGQSVKPAFAGLSPGFAGLYQVNAVVPAGITTGDTVPVTLTVAGQTSPVVTMSVH